MADLESLRVALTELKREVAKVIAAMQLGGDRAKRRELAKRLAVCRKRAKALEAPVSTLLASGEDAGRGELEQAQRFLTQMQAMGTGTGPRELA